MPSTPPSSTLKNLKTAIKRHLDLMGKAIHLTQSMVEAAKKDDHKALTKKSENRKRLVGLIGHIQEKIERSIKVIPQEVYSVKIESNIQRWQNKFNRAIQRILEMDQEILECLNSSKNKIKQELSSNYKNKVAHEKYNLSTLKG